MRDIFANATSYNEWNVVHADTIGLFVHPADRWEVAKLVNFSDVPGYDPSMGDGEVVGAVTVSLAEIMAHFPGLPVYSFSCGEIVEIEPGDRGAALRCRAIHPAVLYR